MVERLRNLYDEYRLTGDSTATWNIDLSFVGKLQIRRLHKSIPFQLPQATATATTAEKPEVDIPKPTEESEDVNQIQDVVEDYGENTQCQDCAEENTDNFMSEWQKANQEMSHLLNRNTEIVVRATKLPQCDIPSMNFQPDIDGKVVELTSFAGITFPLTHISIPRNDFNSLERIYPKLKKHLDLRHYSEQTLSVLAQCKGTEISIEGPWHIWLGVVPLPGTVFQQIRMLNVTKVTYDYIKSVGTTLKSKAAAAALAGRARNTLMKVDLNSVKHWTVMPDECMDVLNLLQVAVDEVTLPDGLTPIIFAFRFGERTKHDISLTGFNMIRKTTVHVGVTISSNDLQILWARHGIQQVTGDRGTLYSCYTFSDIVNFQSNTDGRNIDVSADVLNVCTIPNQVHFVQFYGDIPHRRPRLNVYHPVTGIIVCGDVVNKTTREAIERGVGPYIFSFDQNVNLLRDLRCRMEFVVAVPPVPHVITPDMYVSLPNIERLLQKYDLLVPYVNADDSLLSALRSVGTQMVERLRNLYDEYRLTGDSTATWEAYTLAGHKTFKLIPNKFVALCSPDANDKEGEAERLTTAIIQELELRQLTYARKFNYLRGTAFPWIIPLPQATATATTAEKPEVDIPKPTEESEDVNQIQDVVEDYGENTQCQDVEKPPTTHLPMAVNTFGRPLN
ncbi:thiG [Mytilus coruscus]|uniref:ThiG n=1 Tax=Mytilus coruscus TaxID=42192 RepID=A0A6J8CDP9_MYTCO|nr:thiG [Mytilus coruscus]